MNKFKHVVITQFNLKNLGVGNSFSDDEWLKWNEYRFVFFQENTLQSLLNQTNKDFIWLLAFDESTPKSCLHFIEKWKKIDNIEISFFKGVDNFNSSYKDVLLKVTKGYEWIITSRIDNDDAFHCKAIETIQNEFIEKDRHLISLASGYVFDKNTKLLSHYYYFISPFMSLIEKLGESEILGVYNYGHTKWPNTKFRFWNLIKNREHQKEFSIKYLVGFPYWVQNIHNNLQNTFYRGLPVLNSIDLSEFSSNEISVKGSFKSILKYYSYYMWKMYLFGFLYKLTNR